MGRKKKTTSKKTRLELRFDEDLVEKMRETAEQADISVNQLMQSIAHWAMGCVHVGKPEIRQVEDSYYYETIDEPGHVWFGLDEKLIAEDSNGEILEEIEPYITFSLDFSTSRSIKIGH